MGPSPPSKMEMRKLGWEHPVQAQQVGMFTPLKVMRSSIGRPCHDFEGSSWMNCRRSATFNSNLHICLVRWWRKWIVVARRLVYPVLPGGVILKIKLVQRSNGPSEMQA